MNAYFRTGLLILGLLVCVGAGLYQLHPWWFRQYFAPMARPNADVRSYPIKQRGGFSPGELRAFFEAAAKAEAIGDPLQRCLGYPDPPGSNWSRVVADAYCHYSTLPLPSQAELIGLIRTGHAEELDRRLSDAVQKERTDPNSRGLIDRIYLADFASSSPELRDAIESWKKQRPQSAFAYAASATAYVEAGGDARGTEYVSETASSAFAEMQRLLSKADTEIAAALRFDPMLSPIYRTLLASRRLGGDKQQLKEAMDLALRAAPTNYDVYSEIMESAKPRWYGSTGVMQQIALDAGAQSEKNPLLLLLQPEPAADAANLCGCDERTNPSDYRRVLDRIAQRATMTYAVVSAEQINRYDLAVVYRSEALRFTTNPIRDHSDRLASLANLYRQPALRDAVAQLARNDASYLNQNSNDLDALYDTGESLATTGLWDQAWAISEKLIQSHPKEPEGWVLRALIQARQHRPDLKETDTYLVQHFSDNPKARGAVEQARWDLNQTTGNNKPF